MTEREIKDQATSVKKYMEDTLAVLTGLSITDCRKAYEANPVGTVPQILQYMLDNFELSDKTVSKIEEFINHCEEEE